MHQIWGHNTDLASADSGAVVRALLIPWMLAGLFKPHTLHCPRMGVHDDESFVVTLERGGCHGPCPTYVATLDSTGRVDFCGTSHVTTAGFASWQIDAASMSDVYAALADPDFAHAKEIGGCLDAPEFGIKAIVKGEFRSVFWIECGGGSDPSKNPVLNRVFNRIEAAMKIPPHLEPVWK